MNKISILTIITVTASLLVIGKIPLISASEVSVSTNSSSRQIEYSDSQSKYNLEELRILARAITVKIYSGNTSGSGIIIKQENDCYVVVTNHHVLSRGDNDYSIQTADGEIYPATPVVDAQFENYDLALLEFNSKEKYQVATLGNSTDLEAGDAVVATGFPINGDDKVDGGFKFTQGLVTLIPEKSLTDGYQIGYTNLIQKGMSGGPVINFQGEVVAINGMHAHPLWGDPYLYQDGEQPSPQDKAIMSRSSWAIPINTFLQLATKFSRI